MFVDGAAEVQAAASVAQTASSSKVDVRMADDGGGDQCWATVFLHGKRDQLSFLLEMVFKRLFNYILSALPAGSLIGNVFSPDRPSYMNYGALGTIIGHELNHGFDSIVSERSP